jgi:hypothetical protein
LFFGGTARLCDLRVLEESGAHVLICTDSVIAAPPKNKKNDFGVCGYYKQATPTGFL